MGGCDGAPLEGRIRTDGDHAAMRNVQRCLEILKWNYCGHRNHIQKVTSIVLSNFFLDYSHYSNSELTLALVCACFIGDKISSVESLLFEGKVGI